MYNSGHWMVGSLQSTMANTTKSQFLQELIARFGPLKRLERSQSLFEIGEEAVRVYVRYSRIHRRQRAFYGLREEDLRRLEGHPSVLCFLWDDQQEPLLIPFSEYEEVFQEASPARDGQYKVQVYLDPEGLDFYIAKAGRFNVEANVGWGAIEPLVKVGEKGPLPELSHSQIQTLLGAIGDAKGYDIWVPPNDRDKLDWSLTREYALRSSLPSGFESVSHILQEVDVVWTPKGSGQLRALFEVEHSTPIYSGLLRFNDVHLTVPQLCPRFSVVANNTKRNRFVRQLNRPTFRASGLSDLCTFLEYVNVTHWYNRVVSKIL